MSDTAFFDDFAAALAGDSAALEPWWTDAERGAAGLSVYRNTVAKGCADAIAGLYPTVERIVGPDWMREAARRFAAEHPPTRASLVDYGDAFPKWLEDFPPAVDLPYLVGLARLDRLWTEAHISADAAGIDPGDLAALAPEHLAAARPVLHPSLRFMAFEDGLPGLWSELRRAETAPAVLALSPEPGAILLVRPDGAVADHLISAGGVAFLAACQSGCPLGEAAVAGLAAEPGLDVAGLFAALIAWGALSALNP